MRRDLEKEVVGKKVKTVEVTGMRTIRRYQQRKQFTRPLEGAKITGVERRGKYLLVKLEGGDVLVIHLGMSGQLRRAAGTKEPLAKHTHVVITFTQGGQLRFIDPRTFGEMFVTQLDGIEIEVDELAHLGIDPLETAMSWDYFGELVAQRHAKLKAALMDQKFIAGIGNIYSDEILHHAGLRWDRMSDQLRPRRCAGSTGGGRGAPGRREVPRVVARRRAVRRPVRPEGRLPGPPQGVRPRGSRPVAGAGARSCARRSPAGPPSSARPARCDRTHRRDAGTARQRSCPRGPRSRADRSIAGASLRSARRAFTGAQTGGAAECS